MQFIRSLIFSFFMMALIPPWVIIAIFTLVLPVNLAMRIVSGWAWSVTWLLKVICNLKHEVIGIENIPDEPVIFACKHQSAWETIALQTIIPPAAWILKRELLWIPIFGWGLACIKPIAINRGDRKAALASVLEQGASAHASGRHILVFPEGTRTAYGSSAKYKQGVARLALKTGAKIVPIAHNAGKFWPKQSIMKNSGTIQVVIGEAFTPQSDNLSEITEEVRDWIENAIIE